MATDGSDWGKYIQYVKLKGAVRKIPVWLHYVDPAGHSHKLHLECAKTKDYPVNLEKYYGLIEQSSRRKPNG
jgi:hypothetical protein